MLSPGLTVEDLAPLRCGFRAKYLLDAADKVASGKIHLEELVRAPIEEARASLMTILGVGPKVAECALLYGMGRDGRFSYGRMDEKSHGPFVSRPYPGVLLSLCGNCPAVSFSLLPSE